MSLDQWIDERAAHLHGNLVLDPVMYAASWWGEDGRGWIAAALIRSRRHTDPWPVFLRQITWLGIESAIVNGPAKWTVRRSRPGISPREHRYPFRKPSSSSFPSGHASSSALMATLLSEDGLAPLWWGIALTVAASRVYVGVHHTSDVVAGLAIGTGIGLLARHVELPQLPPPQPAAAGTA